MVCTQDTEDLAVSAGEVGTSVLDVGTELRELVAPMRVRRRFRAPRGDRRERDHRDLLTIRRSPCRSRSIGEAKARPSELLASGARGSAPTIADITSARSAALLASAPSTPRVVQGLTDG